MTFLLRGFRQYGARISTRFYVAVAFAALTTLMMIGVAWQSFERIQFQQEISSSSLPAVVLVVKISKLSGDLAAAVPKLISSATPNEVSQTATENEQIRSELDQQLILLRGYEDAMAANKFSELVAQLNMDVQEVEVAMQQLLELRKQLARHRELLGRTETVLRRTLVPFTDDQFFFLMTGLSELDSPPAPRDVHFNEIEINQYRYISTLEQQSNNALQMLTGIETITDGAFVRIRSELFNSAADSMRHSTELIGDQSIREQITPLVDSLIDLGAGENNGFQLKEQELRLLDRQAALVASSRITSTQLVALAEQLVTAAESRATEAFAETDRVIATSRALIIYIGLAGIIGAAAIVWLLIGRTLIPRLRYLSQRMREMGGGDLDDPVKVTGRDEIADMASALEIFRMNALDARRLNIVEELSENLLAKNTELQSVLDQLKSAQSQIVVREKLAALGELTAGVAHEIKNPLNFVTNFSDLSGELIKELEEIMHDEELDADERDEEITSICKMLSENVERIGEHGARAVRIVNDMLRMGRGGGSAQATDLNQLIEQHTKLAFHGARASTENLQLKMDFELDPELPEIETVSQDIGRVILNIVGNSCYATHKRHLHEIEEVGDKKMCSYVPSLKVVTLFQDGDALMKFTDNGGGIPPEVQKKMFLPFFTTKPTDEGTGLGLAMCNDIIHKHGGEISVKSVAGESTEMTIRIPENAGKILAESEDETNDDHDD